MSRLSTVFVSLLILENLNVFQLIHGASSSSNTQDSSTTTTFPPDAHYNTDYTRRTHYPEYCSTPQHMRQRHIPPLGSKSTNSSIGETRLVHVSTVIRHGARTPWSAELQCWDGFWTSPDTGVWDCNLTTFMTQQQQQQQQQPQQQSTNGRDHNNNDNTNSEEAAMFLFDKRYDALHFPNEDNGGLSNELNGTCQMGQLLSRGHAQQLYNGKILREAYTYTKGDYSHDERMRLIDVSLQDYVPWQAEYLHFRADDDQRTVMSGQVLLRGMLGKELAHYQATTSNQYPTIPLHIADRDRDIVDANKNDCPRLVDIQMQAIQSEEFQDFDESESSQQVRQYMWDHLNMGPETRNSLLDCLMTTMCTDRRLPEAMDDFDGTHDNWFTRMAEYDIETYTKLMKYNQSEFAKLALGPLWWEIMKNINPYLESSQNDVTDTPPVAPKFALIAGHDTTIMPLLASLGPALWNDTDWAPYASMLIIELHELIDGRSDTTIFTSNFAVRLLYNGKILTPLLQGCEPNLELCDVKHFKALVDPIATRNTNCESKLAVAPTNQLSWLTVSTTTGMAIVVTLIVVSGLSGSLLTYAIMKSRYLRYAGRTKISSDTDGVWTIDDDDDDDYGLELREGEFHDEPASNGKQSTFVNGNGY